MNVKNYCYSLAELAERWSCSENDILNLAIQGLHQRKQNSEWCCLSLLVDFTRFPAANGRMIFSWQQLILPNEIAKFFPNQSEAVFTSFRDYEDKTEICVEVDKARLGFRVKRDDIRIMGVDVEQYEKRNDMIAVENKISIDSSISMILEKDHPWYSEPLANAVQAWIELYSKREGNKQDNSHRPAGGNTKLIDDWLDTHLEKIGKTTKEHYRFIVNPSKQGGPQKIPE